MGKHFFFLFFQSVGADPDVLDLHGRTPLLSACAGAFSLSGPGAIESGLRQSYSLESFDEEDVRSKFVRGM